MMQFYKKRDFGALVGDTFGFFKIYGKNYFKNYLLINGLLLIFLMLIFVFGYREFFMQLFGGNTGGETYYFEQYFENNAAMLIFMVVLIFIISLAVAIIAYTFPVFYLQRVSQSDQPVKVDEILGDIRKNFGRIILLMLGLIFVITPIFVVMLLISYVLVLIVIGFFLLLLLVPSFVNVVNFLMYEYLINKKGFFEALSFAVRAQFSYKNQNEKTPFWKYWGTTAVIYFIIYILSAIFSILPLIFFYTTLYTIPSSENGYESNPFSGTMGVIFFILYAISTLVSFLMTNLILIASGLMYYDNRTDLHQQMDILEIDTIGNNG